MERLIICYINDSEVLDLSTEVIKDFEHWYKSSSASCHFFEFQMEDSRKVVSRDGIVRYEITRIPDRVEYDADGFPL